MYVPLVGRIAAGGPILAEESVEDVFPLPRQLVGDGELFVLKVVGDSMIEAAICDGDWVTVRRQPVAENGDIVAAMLDGEATVKRFRAAAQLRVERIHRAGQVPLDQLALQGQGRRGHDHPLPVRQGGRQVAQRLTGAGAGLDQQMRAAVDGFLDGFGHGHLAGTLRTADGGDGGVQEFGE
ncbi:LexA repressor [Streptomyces violaceorubidus]